MSDGSPHDPQPSMWDGGDYAAFAERLRPAAETLAEVVSGAVDGPALDLAAGTGSVAEAIARSGRPVVAVDSAPGLVAQGRDRTADLPVTWVLGSMEELTVDGTFAAAASSFGTIFAVEPESMLRDLHARIRPGGLIAVNSWDPDGYIAQMSTAMAEKMPARARATLLGWIRWGEPATVRAWLADAGFVDVEMRRRGLPWRFPDPDAATDFLFASSPGHVAAGRVVDDPDALRARVRDHLVQVAGDGPVDIEAVYQQWTAHRR